ncbi:MAG: CpcT/CpeT family chromophore lyase [Chitinophagaceae bacterium]
MIRFCWIACLLPMFAAAQKLSDADIRQLKAFSTGVFSNEAQAKADAKFLLTELKVQPIWQKRKDGVWLFAERKDTAHTYQVWHFYLQDANTLLMQISDFKDTSKAAQLSLDIKKETNLVLNNLLVRHGCELYVKKNKTSYEGTSSGKECFANTPGTEYVTLSAVFAKGTLSWQQISYDKEDKELSSTANGNYLFIKQAIKTSK